ncbi:MAG: tetratricopeptide repeat protein [Bacteroidetes bacterium]|nr:tetratricopeptide repeat protein [Bacteroidota bacterium]
MTLISCSDKSHQLQQLLLKGNLALEKQDYQTAANYYKESLRLDACFSDALNNLGTVAFQTGHFAESIDWYDQAIQCSPRKDFYLNRANAHLEDGALFLALSDADKFLSFAPDTIPGLVLKSIVLMRLKKFDEAVAAMDAVLAREPDEPEWWVNRGTLYFFKGKNDLASVDLKHALSIDSNSAEAWNALSMIDAESGKTDSALFKISQALELQSAHPHFINNRGYIFLLKGNLAQAEADINKSMSLEPDNPWVYRNRALIYMEKKEFPSAERLFRQVLSMDSSVDRINYFFAASLAAQNKKSDACQWFNRSVEKSGRYDNLLKICSR